MWRVLTILNFCSFVFAGPEPMRGLGLEKGACFDSFEFFLGFCCARDPEDQNVLNILNFLNFRGAREFKIFKVGKIFWLRGACFDYFEFVPWILLAQSRWEAWDSR